MKMELITNKEPLGMVEGYPTINKKSNGSSFIEGNTMEVELEHLRKDCIIPVFSKDNESTISHYQFVNRIFETAQKCFHNEEINYPEIRVSHQIKGRIPSAVGKPAKELKDHEKTIYYERCAFLIEIPSISREINGQHLTLNIGGVRAYNQENLYSRKSLEKFKLFIGFQNKVCCNLVISTDGFSNEIKVLNIDALEDKANELFLGYSLDKHLVHLENLLQYSLTEVEFAKLMGKCRMYNHMDRNQQKGVFPLLLNDSQCNQIVREYYSCPNFRRAPDGSINLWNLYNLFTEANKSSYIDNNIERNVNTYEFINRLGISKETGVHNWYLLN